MEKDPSRTLSDKVEETIEGVLRFAVRFFRTLVIILFRPLACERILLGAMRSNRTLVRPLTFLAIGGFVFSLTISVYPKGFLGLINIIWYDEEINKVISERWQEALSVTGLIIAAFPVLLTVSACAGLVGRALSPGHRSQFLALNSYLFGYQYFLLFSFFFFTILQAVLSELFGVEVREVLGLQKIQVNELVKQALYVCLAAVFFSALLMPAVGLSRWAARVLGTRPIWLKAGACIGVSVYCLVVLAICSYTASAPAAFKQVAAAKPEKIKIHFLEDPSVHVSAKSAGGRHVVRFDLYVAIESVPTANIIAPKSDLTVGIVGEFEGKNESLWSSDDLKVHSDGGDTTDIVVEKGRIRTFRLTGTTSLPDETFRLIKQKAEKPLESNAFKFFINIRLRQGSDTTDRRLFLDVDKILQPT
jgi:hypothetical protein